MTSRISVVLVPYAVYMIGWISAQQDGAIRLTGTGSNATQGRLEIYHNNIWGTVCMDQFESFEAIVVCRQLGFSTSGAVALKGHTFGPGTGVIWMDGLTCHGTETLLGDCQFNNWNITDCTHSEDVGVRCAPTPTITVTVKPLAKAVVAPNSGTCLTNNSIVRLVGPADLPGVGVVQVYRNGTWGGVCDDDWNMNNAKVVCRMLCYSPELALAGSVTFDTSAINETMAISNVMCQGNETSITSCPQSNWQPGICSKTYEKARVTCVALDNSAPSRPDPILECFNGSLTASFNKSRDPNLETMSLQLANMSYIGPCNVIYQNSTNFVTIIIPFTECGTQSSYNATHILYENTILYMPTKTVGVVSTTNTYLVSLLCALPRDLVAEKPFVPQTESVTKSAIGEFIVNLYFFRNNSFTTAVTRFPLEIPVGEWLFAALGLQYVDTNLRLVVPNCYATPTANRNDINRYPLFTNKCMDVNMAFFPINDTWFGFRFQTFKFLQYSEVHIHCDAYICEKQDPSNACDRSCFSNNITVRRKRSVQMKVVHVSSETLVLYETSIESSANNSVVSTSQTTSISSSTTSRIRPSSAISSQKSSGESTQPQSISAKLFLDKIRNADVAATTPTPQDAFAAPSLKEIFDSANDATVHLLTLYSYVMFIFLTFLYN